MSEEEIKEIIKNMLLHAETQLLDYEALAIQGLLDLYNKAKEKNKNVRDRIEFYLLNNSAVENNPNRIREELVKLQKMLEEDNK